MEEQYKIRKAQEKDIPYINDLLQQVCLVHHNGRPDIFKYGAKKYTDEQLIGIMHNEKTPILVAENEIGAVVGYAFLIFKQELNHNILTDIKSLYIDDLCVDEHLRGQHIGKKLYDAVVDYAKEHDCYSITLNVWALNEPAMKFYEKCGLKPQKTVMEMIL